MSQYLKVFHNTAFYTPDLTAYVAGVNKYLSVC